MKKLAEEGVLAGFITTFDYSVLGLERYKIFFSTKPSERKKIASYFCELPNTYVVLTKLGAWDLEVEVIAQNGFELQKLIRETLRKFPNAIRNYETTSLFKDRFNKHDFAYLKQR
jgi:DNA-binding Lrp family transcriptional regulator